MADREDQTYSLTVWFNRSISGTCSFLDAQFRDIPISSIYAHRGSNSLSACLRVIFKTSCMYSLFTCLITSSMFFNFLFLIILPVENIMCQDMVFMNPIPLMCMRSQHMVTFLYLSRMLLCKFGTMLGSTCWIFWQTDLPCKFGTLCPYVSSAIPTSSWRIGIFYRMLLSTACRIFFTGWPVMFWNLLAISALFTSQAVHCFFFYSTFGMGNRE